MGGISGNSMIQNVPQCGFMVKNVIVSAVHERVIGECRPGARTNSPTVLTVREPEPPQTLHNPDSQDSSGSHPKQTL